MIALVSAEIGVQTKGKAKPQLCSLSVLAKHLICKKRLEFPNETLTVEGRIRVITASVASGRSLSESIVALEERNNQSTTALT